MKPHVGLFIITLLSLTIASCGQGRETDHSQSKTIKDTVLNQQNSSQKNASDIISFPCAIILTPTNKIIDSLKKSNEADFYTVTDDIMFYQSIAMHYLDSVKLKTINMTSQGNIMFHLSNGHDFLFNLSGQRWCILLFNGKDKPIISDITNFKTTFNRYMQSK